MPTAIQAEICANCGLTIGRLETPHLWREEVVCAGCHGRLSMPPARAVAVPPPVVIIPAPVYPRVQTIERTGKTWKAMGALATLTVIGAMVVGGIGIFDGVPLMVVVGVLLLVAGFGLSIMARLGAWWYHG